MQKTKFILLALLTTITSASLLLTSCSNSSGGNGSAATPAVVTPLNIKPGIGDIVVIGDSLANGYRATDPNVTPEGCLSFLPHNNMRNLSVPGLTSRQILATVTSIETNSVKPKLIFVSSGGNDALTEMSRPGLYPASQSLSEMNQMFERLTATGALVVYLGLNPGIPGAERLPDISSLAVSKGVVVVDGMKDLWQNPVMMADRLHPNNDGYRIMCDRILASIFGLYP